MRTLKLTLAYDGTDYAGWQRQPDVPTIQALLEDSLQEIEGRAVTVYGAARTDAGVHALGQVASVQLCHPIETPTLVRALNARLPGDIRVLLAEQVFDGFHARYGARSKSYRYRLSSTPVANPLERRFAWHVAPPIDLGAMQRAGAALCGRHDFAAFQTSADEAERISTVRTIHALKVGAEPVPDWLIPSGSTSSEVITVDVVGDGFLRYMVRTIVGTLVEVGTARRRVEDVAGALASRRRQRAGPTAPGRGLFLISVDYP